MGMSDLIVLFFGNAKAQSSAWEGGRQLPQDVFGVGTPHFRQRPGAVIVVVGSAAGTGDTVSHAA